MDDVAEEALLFGPFSLRPRAVELRRDNIVLTMRPKCFDLLVYLALHPDRLITVTELLEHVWRGVVVNEGTVTRTVAELRFALAEDAEHPKYIETVSRRGYKFIANVRRQRRGIRSDRSDEMPCFALVHEGQEFPLWDGEHLIGRGPDVAVPLFGPAVSRHHARVIASGESLTLEDLSSRNGTFVNGILAAGSVALYTGDEIRIGDDRLVVWGRHAATRSVE